MARRTFLLSEVTLTEEIVNQSVSGDLTVAGASAFTGVASFGDGLVTAPAITFINDPDTGFYRTSTDDIRVAAGGAIVGQWNGTALTVPSGVYLSIAGDVNLQRDAAAVLALKNSSTAQTMRIYGDATAATLKYMTLTHDGTNGLITTSGGTFGFGTHTTSAGTNINGVTGYISIVDSGGTERRLAVLT